MRKSFIAALLLVIAVIPASAERIGLAVVGIEPIGVSRDVARIVEEMVQGEFAKLPIFRLVERERLGSLLAEQQLQLSGVTNAESAVRAGGILNVRKVVFGTIGKYKTDYISYILTLRLVDVERGVVEASENTDVVNDGDIRAAAERLVARLAARVSISGRIAKLGDGVVYTDMGSELGVKPGDLLSVFRVALVKDSDGRVIMREETAVANLVAGEVSEDGSRCRVVERSGEVAEGLTVKPGKANIAGAVKGSGIVIKSIPDNARVFLDSEFIGVTPVSQEGIKPGVYTVEIRGSGYKPYMGRISLGEGRTVAIERELEQVIEVEDLLMLGEVPRKRTDPATALRLSLIPGAGLIYNGYPTAAPAVDFAMAWGLGFSVMYALTPMNDFDPTAKDRYISGDTSYSTMYSAAVYDTGLKYENIFMGSNIVFALIPYLTSILDGPRTAGDEYTYPVFFEVSMGANGGLFFLRQTDDTKATSVEKDDSGFYEYLDGVSAPGYGFSAAMLLESRKYLVNFGIQLGLPEISLDLGVIYRLFSRGELLPGIGMLYNLNFGTLFLNYNPSPSVFDIALAGSISLRKRTLEFDAALAPVELYHFLSLGRPDTDNYRETIAVFVAGPRIDLDMRWFFKKGVGLRLKVSAKQMWNITPAPVLDGYTFTTLDQYRQLKVDAGMVFRF